MKYLSKSEKIYINILTIIATIFLLVIIGKLTGVIYGEDETIENRALNTELKNCYSWQDIEIIVFGEIQE